VVESGQCGQFDLDVDHAAAGLGLDAAAEHRSPAHRCAAATPFRASDCVTVAGFKPGIASGTSASPNTPDPIGSSTPVDPADRLPVSDRESASGTSGVAEHAVPIGSSPPCGAVTLPVSDRESESSSGSRGCRASASAVIGSIDGQSWNGRAGE
jgi:hypothetical protein